LSLNYLLLNQFCVIVINSKFQNPPKIFYPKLKPWFQF